MKRVNFLTHCEELAQWHADKSEPTFIICDESQLSQVGEKINIRLLPKYHHSSERAAVRFETTRKIDHFSFVFCQKKEKASAFDFETFSLFYNPNVLVFSVKEKGVLHQQFLAELLPRLNFESLSEIYLEIIDYSLIEIFDSFYAFEEVLTTMENKILSADGNYSIEEIISLKNQSFKVKKYMRLLLYVSDDLLLNVNQFIPENDIRFFESLDHRINRVYEFSNSLYEMCVHLLEVYDSTVTTRTNDIINKLTVFTVFATPITVLTGIYGMNFVNMPELRNPNGYYIVLGIMVIILLVIYLILKKIKLL